jgi:hypothetical protein
VLLIPTVSAFRLSVLENGRKVSQQDVVVDQNDMITTDAIERQMDAVVEAVKSGRMTLLP